MTSDNSYLSGNVSFIAGVGGGGGETRSFLSLGVPRTDVKTPFVGKSKQNPPYLSLLNRQSVSSDTQNGPQIFKPTQKYQASLLL